MSGKDLKFEQIHATFRSKINRFLIRMMGEYEAEDLTQEVFVRVNQAMKSFRGESELSTWIYRIATNAAIDRLRSPSYQRTIQDCPTDHDNKDGENDIGGIHVRTEEKASLVEQQVYRNEMNGCIQNFINHLPEAYRTVLVLSEFEGFKNTEIVEILGVTLETVKIRLHRARERLKEEFIAHCGSEWVEGNEFVPELKRPDFASPSPRLRNR